MTDAYQLSFSDNRFDAFFGHNVLENIPEPINALKEMHRVLKPGGIIGLRDIDFGGILTVPDDGLLEHANAIAETDWPEMPGAFHARSHCEAIGRKA